MITSSLAVDASPCKTTGAIQANVRFGVCLCIGVSRIRRCYRAVLVLKDP